MTDHNLKSLLLHGRRSLFVLLCGLFLLHASSLLSAQESDPDLLIVAETHWGFDARVPLHEFVPLSIQVKNLGSTPWQGMLRLSRVVRGNRQFGATIVEEISLQGDESRWIQVTPYVIDDLEDWELRWGDGKNHVVTLPPVIKSDRPTVLVYDTDDVSQSSTVFKRMPEERFPTSVTATHGLRGVILDRVPFWQGARARAFHDWVLLGGRVYILQNHEGDYPRFPKALGFLNGEQNKFNVGSGIVKKIPLKVEDFALDEARSKIFNDDLNSADKNKHSEVLRNKYNQGLANYGMNQHVWSKHYDTFKPLTEISKYKRHWWLIYSAVLGYLLVQYPGCFVVGTQHKKVARFYALFFAAALFFSLVFSLLGQVGGQSRNRIRSVEIARSLGGGDFELTGWTILSNIVAGTHAVEFPGSGQIYSTTQEAESVNGTMNPGNGGGVAFQMLPNSKQTLYHRQRVRTNYAIPRLITENTGDLRTRSFLIDTTNCFPEEPIYALAVLQGSVYHLKVDGKFLKMQRTKVPESLLNYLQRSYEFGYNTWGGPTKVNDEDEEKEKKLVGLKRYIKLVRPLVGNSFGLVNEIDLRKLKLDNQTLRLFVLTESPTEFLPDSDEFPDREGAVLFTYDLKL